MTAMGISADTAAALAKFGLTAADVAEYAAVNELTEAKAGELLVS